MAGFRLGVRLRPLNKSGQRLHPQGAFESIGGPPGGPNDTAAGPKTKGAGPGEEEHPTGSFPGGSGATSKRRHPAANPKAALEKMLDM